MKMYLYILLSSFLENNSKEKKGILKISQDTWENQLINKHSFKEKKEYRKKKPFNKMTI